MLVGLAIIGGLILFIIPGIYIGVRLAVSIEALVVEGRRGTEAMGRSWELVGGHWWHAFGTLVVAGLLTGILNAVITRPVQRYWLVRPGGGGRGGHGGHPALWRAGRGPALPGPAVRKERLTLETLRTDLRASAA